MTDTTLKVVLPQVVTVTARVMDASGAYGAGYRGPHRQLSHR